MSSQNYEGYHEWRNEVARQAAKERERDARRRRREESEVAVLTKRWFRVTIWFVAVPAAMGSFGITYSDWSLGFAADPVEFLSAMFFGSALTGGILFCTIWPFILALQRIIPSMRWRHRSSLKSVLAGLSVGLLTPSTIFLSLFAAACFVYPDATKPTQLVHTYAFLLVLSFPAQFITLPVGGILGFAIGQAIRLFLRTNDRPLPPHLGVIRPNH
jgi:hypothetical protein